MSKSTDELLIDISNACQDLKKAKKKSDLESRRLQAAVAILKCKRPQSGPMFINRSSTTDVPETPFVASEERVTEDCNANSDDELLSLGGCSPGAYGIRLVEKFFSTEELKTAIFSPRKSTKRTVMHGPKVDRLKRLVNRKFPNRYEEARRAINQHCRDLCKHISKPIA